MAGSCQSFADHVTSEVTLSLFTDLARAEGPPLSDAPPPGGGGSGEPLGQSADLTLRDSQLWAAARHWWGHQQMTSWASIASIKGTVISAGAGGGLAGGCDVMLKDEGNTEHPP